MINKVDQPDDEMIVVAGRQLVTAEGLELLALVTPDKFPDGMSLDVAVDKVTGSGGVAVCPWGAGKWLGGRGKVLQQFCQKSSTGFFLGDSGGRPSIWPRSKFCSRAPFNSKLVSGSDPLPLNGQENVAGSFGGIIRDVCVNDEPALHLKKILLQDSTTVRPYGRPMCSVTFTKNQIALRRNK